MKAGEDLLTPGQVAERLGVSSSGLRRLAGIYASLMGELPRDSSGRNRMWPLEAVERLELSRRLVLSGRVGSIREGLEALSRGEVSKAELEAESPADTRYRNSPEQFGESLTRLRDELLGELVSIREELELLRGELARLSGSDLRSAGSAGELDELRRRLRYLQRELEYREV